MAEPQLQRFQSSPGAGAPRLDRAHRHRWEEWREQEEVARADHGHLRRSNNSGSAVGDGSNSRIRQLKKRHELGGAHLSALRFRIRADENGRPPSPIPSEEARDALVTAAEQHFSNSQKGSDDRGGDVRSKDEVRGMHDGASSTITALERLVEQEEEALRQERAILDQGIEVLSALETAAKEADAQLARESRDAVIEVSGFLKSTALGLSPNTTIL